MNDAMARERALDPTQSFIVQAPAGSGKTELLTQRYLCLLAHAEKSPEEIIAITFTRKAAAEMRSRILNALTLAENPSPPPEAHLKTTWMLAQTALKKDKALGWQLQNNPNQLRVLTIDALATSITAQMPLLTGFGIQPKIADNPDAYYEEAIQTTLNNLGDQNENSAISTAIEELLLHFDNNASFLQALLTRFLAQREQWLGHIVPHQHQAHELKRLLESNLKQITVEKNHAVKTHFDSDLLAETLALAGRAGHEINEHSWKKLAALLLTQKGTWRKTVDKRQGFTQKEDKVQMRALLEELTKHEALRQALYALWQCPPVCYSDQEWKVINALLSILPRCAAELTLLFQQTATIDFIELNLQALNALGEHDAPTDLALYFDYQIRHLLIDEFQDTSVMQFRLMEQLVSGWVPHDGKTLFLVGDPMQSIYRFRNAEVGLFLRAKEQGVGDVSLESLALQCNFRSQAPLVNWTNRVFQGIFPDSADIASGAIPYNTVSATQHDAGSISYTVLENGTPEAEAIAVLNAVKHYQRIDPTGSIAILVRSRSQLSSIIPALQEAMLPFHAIDIESLAEQPVIQDLMTLTRALLHLGDRLAWLSLLRAPWCGLTLHDLHAVARHSREKPLWQSLSDFNTIPNLSDDAIKRLSRIVPALQYAFEAQGRLPLARWLNNTWLALGGPAAVQDKNALQEATAFFKSIEEIEDDFTLSTLAQRLQTLYAKPCPSSDSTLHIMTIHKAKGLEFDHVILPNLQRRSPYDASALLMCWERPTLTGTNDLLLAPIKASHEKENPLYAYLRSIEKEKSQYEIARLLYVAVTRAKSSLKLIACVPAEEDTLKKPIKGSFLNLLWDVEKQALQDNSKRGGDVILPSEDNHRQLARLRATWKSPFLQKEFTEKTFAQTTPSNEHLPERHLGTLIHQIFETIGNEGLNDWRGDRIQKSLPQWLTSLQHMGLAKETAKTLLTPLIQPLKDTLHSAETKWLFSPAHRSAKNEYAITAHLDGNIIHSIIDRTFIDKDDVRWIIDYKTSVPHNQALPLFLEEQKKRHEKQLTQYARIFRLKETRAIQLALYFPLCNAWCKWTYEG